jgi:hypothetical protein
MLLSILAAGLAANHEDSWTRHSTLVVGVVGIVFSGFVGPTATGLLTDWRERKRDKRALVVARREDLLIVVDEAAAVLAGAVTKLRPLLAAVEAGQNAPKEPADFISTVFPLGQRLRLRLPGHHAVVVAYEEAREKLVILSKATSSQAVFDTAIESFEASRAAFLDAARMSLHAPIKKETVI